ncbi:MAG: ribonuclease HI [Alphaproteobacteria bacterium]|nr:ribonuclease HI [Alphaproteobacteria bacterium]
MSELTNIEIYTDGACSGNPGPGGWGAILKKGDTLKELSGGAVMTTNNRMELQAVIEGLKSLTRPCRVDIYTDSRYVSDGVEKWLVNWKKRGWKSASGDPVKNIEQWKELHDLVEMHTCKFHWVKGHNGHPMNERADELARGAIPKTPR